MKRKTKPSGKKPSNASARVIQLTLRVRFRTNFGQAIFATGDHASLGNGSIENAVSLHYVNESSWEVTLSLPVAKNHWPITYNYFIRETDGTLTHDWGTDKKINPAEFEQNDILIIDSWNYAGFYDNAFYTKPFRDVLLPFVSPISKTPASETTTHRFKVKSPLLSSGQTVCLIGNQTALRNWDAQDPILLHKAKGEDFFAAGVNLSEASFPLEYRYGIYDVPNRKLVRLEEGGNRTLNEPAIAGKQIILNDGFVVAPASTWKGAGIALPVFSLRSAASFGVGEFTDLKLLVDWGKEAGFKLIQILPINDTIATHTWVDSYPYAAISAFALHPLYLNLEKMAGAAGVALLKKMELERKRLNALEAVDYEAVMNHKLAFIKKVFPALKRKTFASKDYQQFFQQNRHWLAPYAAFSYFRDKFGTADFSQWPAQRTYDAKAIAKLAAKNPAVRTELERHYFVQYHLHCQLKAATDYAHAHGIVVKGDLPIGIYRNGADAWERPELYHLDVQAGAPPDPFAEKGQNWGFPTYNWERMKADGYAWWKQRCEQMGLYFDAFRIDHVLGFFRIWSIPLHAVEGILGYFVPAVPVEVAEFAEHGIAFDHRRYTQPYITDQVLTDIFQQDAEQVKREFLLSDATGNYKLKPSFQTQRQVEHYFASRKANDLNKKLTLGLYDLISNVILFEVEKSGGKQFHFRLGMENTSSFKNLEPHTQAQLKELYIHYFFRRQDQRWREEAMEKLPALKRVTDMLVCGEDLGMVPDCVPDVMRQLGLLSLEIQRMPKDPRKEFSYPEDAPYLSVVTPSTHDMSTIRGWWGEEDKNKIRNFYQNDLNQPGNPPSSCEGWVNRAIVIQHLESPAMWSIFQLQDLLGMDEALRRKNVHEERINVPANPKHYWRYRMHLTLESLKKAHAFTNELRQYLQLSGRVLPDGH